MYKELEELKHLRTGCITVVDEKGNKIDVCAIPAEDLGEKVIVVNADEDIKSFKKIDKTIKYLRKLGVSRKDRERVLEFSNQKLRPAKISYDGLEGRVDFIGIKKEKFREI